MSAVTRRQEREAHANRRGMEARPVDHHGRVSRVTTSKAPKGGTRPRWKGLRWVRDLRGAGPYRVPAGPLWHPERQAREKYRERVKKLHLRGSETAVLDYLLVASDDGLKPSWPSQERMANELHLDERTVERAVARLKQLGLIVADVCKFVQPCEARPRRGRSRPNCHKRPRTNRYYFVIDIADHRGQLAWFRTQIRPAPNPGAGPELPPGDPDRPSPANDDGTTPERNTGPPERSGDIPTGSDRREDDSEPSPTPPEVAALIAKMRSALKR